MRRIAIINQKGGVGKTTTAVGLGAALARLGQRVLLMDLDPQCNLTVHVDVDPAADEPSVYELLRGRARLEDVVRPTRDDGLSVVPASVDLAGVELELVNEVGRETVLAGVFDDDPWLREHPFDYVLVDCPPSLGLLAINALVLCDEVFVPVQAEFFALQGVGKLLEVVELVQRRLNPRLAITGVIACRYDPSTNLSRAVLDELRQHFGETVMDTMIRRNVKLAEAPSHGKTIYAYDKESRGAQDYLALAREVLGVEDVAPEVELPLGPPAPPEELLAVPTVPVARQLPPRTAPAPVERAAES